MRPLACACLLVAVAAAAQPPALERSSDGAVVRGRRDVKVLALVFTGHEFGEGGTTILDALAARRARASFFLTGDFLRRPDFEPLVRRIVEDGHYLGPHSDKHLLYCDWTAAKKTLVTREQFETDLERNVAAIERFGVPADRIRYFLPAYEWCNREIVAWAGSLGFETINFTPGTRSNADYMEDADAKFVSSPAIEESILRAEQSQPGGLGGFLLLLHVGAGPRRTDKMHARLGGLLDRLAARGYRFVRIDEIT
jgi:endoglucanase